MHMTLPTGPPHTTMHACWLGNCAQGQGHDKKTNSRAAAHRHVKTVWGEAQFELLAQEAFMQKCEDHWRQQFERC
eukprot:1159902-Pelagomonas_calceolata.AAC.1